jgi:hypothetical protein
MADQRDLLLDVEANILSPAGSGEYPGCTITAVPRSKAARGRDCLLLKWSPQANSMTAGGNTLDGGIQEFDTDPVDRVRHRRDRFRV